MLGMARVPRTTLRQKYPDIDLYWHPTKNGDLTPDNVGVRSEKIAWFRCPNDPYHDHQARVKNKTLVADRCDGRWGCPLCSGYYLGSPKDSLASKQPQIAKDWHPTKNSELTPQSIPPSSNKKFWWRCPRGHEYQLEPNQRVHRSRGCPECSSYGYGSSQEIRIYCELKALFSDIKFRHKVDGKEIDILIPNLGIGIEYDSEFYHRDKIEEDQAKNDLMARSGFHLLRVREHPLEKVTEFDVITPTRQLSKSDMNGLLESLRTIVPDMADQVVEYQHASDFINDVDYASYTSYSDRPIPENSLAHRHPEVASQWDYERNAPLTPDDFSYGSRHRAWWLCDNGHSFDAIIGSRTSHVGGRYKGCRYCAWERKLPLGDKQDDLFSE